MLGRWWTDPAVVAVKNLSAVGERICPALKRGSGTRFITIGTDDAECAPLNRSVIGLEYFPTARPCLGAPGRVTRSAPSKANRMDRGHKLDHKEPVHLSGRGVILDFIAELD